jgi:multidrug efflux pump subunit AcrA (membrane-fusion protein)
MQKKIFRSTLKFQGVVTAVYVSVGQNVSKGQVVAQLDDKVLRQNIARITNTN